MTEGTRSRPSAAKGKIGEAEIRALCAESVTQPLVPTGADAFGISHNRAYELANLNQFPCKVIRVGTLWRILSADLLHCLGLDAE